MIFGHALFLGQALLQTNHPKLGSLDPWATHLLVLYSFFSYEPNQLEMLAQGMQEDTEKVSHISLSVKSFSARLWLTSHFRHPHFHLNLVFLLSAQLQCRWQNVNGPRRNSNMVSEPMVNNIEMSNVIAVDQRVWPSRPLFYTFRAIRTRT